jgi:hypothetical protein
MMETNTLFPDDYLFTVFSLPEVIKGHLIKVTFIAYLDMKDGEESSGTYIEWFDIKQPKKLLCFLKAIGEPHSDTEKFSITPSHWYRKSCNVCLRLKTWIDQNNQQHEMKLLEFHEFFE